MRREEVSLGDLRRPFQTKFFYEYMIFFFLFQKFWTHSYSVLWISVYSGELSAKASESSIPRA